MTAATQIFESRLHLTRLIGIEDASLYRQIGALHREQLAAGVLAQFPERFLAGFYRYLANQADCVVFTMQDQDRVVGFATGTMRASGLLVSFVMASPIEVMRLSIPLIFKPRVLGRVLSLLSFMMMGAERSYYGDRQLLSIAVLSANERSGVGAALFAALCGWFQSVGAMSFDIIAATTQTSALQFYKRHGATEIGHAVLGGLDSFIFRHVL
jgi:GNAT superfamily N-acetyltransferase